MELNLYYPLTHDTLRSALRAAGRSAEAIAIYRKLIEGAPKYAVLHWYHGNALGDENKMEEAIASYCKAIELDPKYALAYSNRGLAYRALKQYDRALADFAKAVELIPDDAQAWWLRHSIYVSLKQFNRAVADYSKAVDRKPDHVLAWYYRGLAHAGLKQYDQAVADYSKSLQLQPGSMGALLARSQTYQALKQWDKALADYDVAIVIDPKNVYVLRKRAYLYADLKQWDKAIAEQARLLELLGPKASPNDLAWLLATCPDPKFRNAARAVELMKKDVEMYPKSGASWNTLGVAHYRAGDWKAARTALHKSMDLRQGGDAFDWFFLTMAHWQQGESDEARKWFDQAVAWMDKNQPENEELRRFRAEAEELLKKEPEDSKQQSKGKR
jgi:tetratricopeptide (TPR) repeat protein